MPDATITSTASTFGTISGVFSADQSTISGTISGIVPGTLTGSVGVPGPQGPTGATGATGATGPTGPAGAPGVGVPVGGTAGQFLTKIDGTNYNTDWTTVNLSAYAPLNSPAFTGNPTAPTAALGDNDTSLATTAFVQQELASGVAVAKNLEVYVRNQSGSTIPAGSIVYISGATGNKPLITLAQANNDANSAQTMGFTKTAIANNGFGYVIVRGELENIDTSALTEGVQLYLSPTTAGTWTTTKPSAPQHLVYVGIVVRAHPTQGIILVAVQNGYELNELHDVKITSASNGQVLKYDSAQGLWVNGTDVGGVAWGGITGTLSSQTDLQTALDGKYSTSNPAGYITSSALSPYLLSSTAASTYQTQAAMSSYLTSSTAASTYATILEPSVDGILTVEPSGSNTATLRVNQDANNYIHLRAGVGQIAMVYGGTTRWFFNDTYLQFPGGTQQTVAYPGSSGFLLKADNLSGLADTAVSRTNLGLGTMAVETATNYLTTASASSTYFTIANAANKADLASPTFTGTPSLPTGTIGVTQTAGNNTTALATTAFVTAAVPAIATNAQAVAQSSASTVITPANAPFVLSNGLTQRFDYLNISAISGSAAATTSFSGYRQVYTTATASAGRAAFLGGVFGSNLSLTQTLSQEGIINFSKKIWMSGRFVSNINATYVGDANCNVSISVGGYSTNTTGNMTVRGIGLRKAGGASSLIQLVVHNGTTQTTVNTSKTVATGEIVEYLIYSNGAGNVDLYINGTLEASSSAGPTGNSGSYQTIYREQVEQTASATARMLLNSFGGQIIFER